LVERHDHRAGEVAGLNEAAEFHGAGEVRALADDHKPGIRPNLKWLEAAEPRSRDALRHLTRRDAGHGLADLADVIRCRAAAAPGGVEETARRELAQQPARDRWVLVKTAEGVGQSGVRVARDVT